MSGGRVLASGGKTAVEKTRGLRGRLARVVDTLPDAAPRVRVDAAPADVAEALTRVEDWLERERPRFERGLVRELRREYEVAVWP